MMLYTVIGLGQFGIELCRELSNRSNIEVRAIGANQDETNAVKSFVDDSSHIDFSNPKAALEQFDFDENSHVIVAIGNSFEDNLMMVSCLQEIGVTHIYARVINEQHEYILNKMNVDARIHLARMSAILLASQLDALDYARVSPLDEHHSIAEIDMPYEWVGKGLGDVGLRDQFELNLLSVRRGPAEKPQEGRLLLELPTAPIIGPPDAKTFIFEKGDILVLFGREDKLAKFAKFVKSTNAKFTNSEHKA